ncbi:MAG: tyrosine-type recombinase/integrase [Promethearchaeota archaeon]
MNINFSDKVMYLESKYELEIEQSLSLLSLESQEEELRKYNQYLVAIGRKISTRKTYISVLSRYGRFLKKLFRGATKEDIKQFLVLNSDKEINYQKNIKIAIKIFYKYLSGIPFSKKGKYPEIVDWIEIPNVKMKKIKPSELLTQEEICQLLEGETNVKYRALWAFLLESGCRPHEIYNLQIQDITFDEYGALFWVSNYTKTGTRPVRLIKSIPYLKAWLNNHPKGNNKKAYLWPGRGGPLKPTSINTIFKRTCEQVGITKNVSQYVCRKQRYSELANSKYLSESQAKAAMGHDPDSKSIIRYVLIDQNKVDAAIIQASGGKINPDTFKVEIGSLPIPHLCPRCGLTTAPTHQFCVGCHFDFKNPENSPSVQNQLMDRDAKLIELEKQLQRKDIALKDQEKRITELYESMQQIKDFIKNKL